MPAKELLRSRLEDLNICSDYREILADYIEIFYRQIKLKSSNTNIFLQNGLLYAGSNRCINIFDSKTLSSKKEISIEEGLQCLQVMKNHVILKDDKKPRFMHVLNLNNGIDVKIALPREFNSMEQEDEMIYTAFDKSIKAFYSGDPKHSLDRVFDFNISLIRSYSDKINVIGYSKDSFDCGYFALINPKSLQPIECVDIKRVFGVTWGKNKCFFTSVVDNSLNVIHLDDPQEIKRIGLQHLAKPRYLITSDDIDYVYIKDDSPGIIHVVDAQNNNFIKSIEINGLGLIKLIVFDKYVFVVSSHYVEIIDSVTNEIVRSPIRMPRMPSFIALEGDMIYIKFSGSVIHIYSLYHEF